MMSENGIKNGDVDDQRKEDKGMIGMVSRRAAIFGFVTLVFSSAISFLQQYMLTGTIFQMANELEFGERECRVHNETIVQKHIGGLNMTLEQFCFDEGRCDPNRTSYIPGACSWFYTGIGSHYDLLAGPIYLVIQGITLLPMLGLLQATSLKFNGSLAILTILHSTTILVTAFVNDYWAIALLRFLFGITLGPCGPLIYSYISQVFPQDGQALVFGILQYGATCGIGLGYVFGAVSNAIGWRLCYIISGTIGIGLGFVAIFIVNPNIQGSKNKVGKADSRQDRTQLDWILLAPLLISNVSRTGSMYISTYYVPVFLHTYFPDFSVTMASIVALVVGLPGCIIGGLLADHLHRRYGVLGKLVLVIALGMSGVILCPLLWTTPAPYFVIPYGSAYFVATFVFLASSSIISDLTPVHSRTLVFGITFFTSHSIGGAVNLLVTPTSNTLSLRGALILLGMVLNVTTTTFISMIPCMMKRRSRDKGQMYKQGPEEVGERTPLLD